jgi:hypothetical protein
VKALRFERGLLIGASTIAKKCHILLITLAKKLSNLTPKRQHEQTIDPLKKQIFIDFIVCFSHAFIWAGNRIKNKLASSKEFK